MKYDVFICHASEDKRGVATPLSMKLKEKGLKVWYDEFELKLGDSLLKKIDEGLLKSKYGVVILSKNFFQKKWAQSELDGLFQKEIKGEKVILPIWHKIDEDAVRNYSPILAGKLAAKTEIGLDSIADKILEIVLQGEQGKSLASQIDSPVKIMYEEEDISQDLHRYSLNISFKSDYPTTINACKLILHWPTLVTIKSNKGFKVYTHKGLDFDYLEMVLEYDKKIFPREKIYLVESDIDGNVKLEYIFEHRTWDRTEEGDYYLFWELFLDNQQPLRGKVNFKQLNIF